MADEGVQNKSSIMLIEKKVPSASPSTETIVSAPASPSTGTTATMVSSCGNESLYVTDEFLHVEISDIQQAGSGASPTEVSTVGTPVSQR